VNPLSRILFNQVNSITVSNTAVETTLKGTGLGLSTLPAGYLFVGRAVRVYAAGFYGTQAVPVTLNIRIKLGSTVVLTTGDQTPSGSMTTQMWWLSGLITCRIVGVTGTVNAQGRWMHMAEAAGADDAGTPIVWGMKNTASTTLDTTIAQAIDVTADWGAGVAAADTITCTSLVYEVLN